MPWLQNMATNTLELTNGLASKSHNLVLECIWLVWFDENSGNCCRRSLIPKTLLQTLLWHSLTFVLHFYKTSSLIFCVLLFINLSKACCYFTFTELLLMKTVFFWNWMDYFDLSFKKLWWMSVHNNTCNILVILAALWSPFSTFCLYFTFLLFFTTEYHAISVCISLSFSFATECHAISKHTLHISKHTHFLHIFIKITFLLIYECIHSTGLWALLRIIWF